MQVAGNAGIIPHMDNPLILKIDERLSALGMTEHAATLRAGLSKDSIRDLRRGKKRTLRYEALVRLAAVLDTTVQWLLAPVARESASDVTEDETPTVEDGTVEFEIANVRLPHYQSMPQDVPVLGTAAGSIIMEVVGFQFEGGTIEYVRRPPGLMGVKDLYAIYVIGDSMYPMHPAGELRFVHPRRPARPGDTVVIQTRHHEDDPGQAYIKILRRQTPDKLILEQFSPNATLEIHNRFVVAVHRVLTMNEMFGI